MSVITPGRTSLSPSPCPAPSVQKIKNSDEFRTIRTKLPKEAQVVSADIDKMDEAYRFQGKQLRLSKLKGERLEIEKEHLSARNQCNKTSMQRMFESAEKARGASATIRQTDDQRCKEERRIHRTGEQFLRDDD